MLFHPQHNDITNIINQFEKLKDEMMLHFKDIALITIPFIPKYPTLNESIQKFNNHIHTIAEQNNFKILDLHSAIMTEPENCFEK